MPSRSRQRQRRRPVRRQITRRRRLSRAARQRNANSKAINTLTKDLYVPRSFQLQQHGTLNEYQHIYPIVFPSEYTACFQNYNSIAGTGVGSIYHMSGVRTRWMIQPESILNNTADVWIQVFIVSLRRAQGRKFRKNQLALTEDLHFVYAPLDSSGGLVDGFTHIMLNKEIFNVHYSSGQRRIGNATLMDEEVTNIRDTATFGSTYTPWRRTIKSESANQVFTAMDNTDIRDSAQLYFLIFSNAQESSELFFSTNHVIYGTSTRGV